jgi:prolyl oligopeptidase
MESLLLRTFEEGSIRISFHTILVADFHEMNNRDEYGEEWHKGGILNRKQNVFDDFQAAAKELVKMKLTSHSKIAIVGGSNGGLLVAACLNQAPELFGAAVAQVPVTDMLRFHQFTIGKAWCSDYGISSDPEQFKSLYAYSPVHNVPKDKLFPALMVCTADHDDRVVPLHSYKYISQVQETVGSNPNQKNPLVVRIETKAGHGAGKPMEKVLEETADLFAFISKYTGAVWVD